MLNHLKPLIFLLAALSNCAYAAGLLGIDNPAKNGQVTQAYTNVSAFVGNDQVAMSEYAGNWAGTYSPRSGNNIGLLAARAEAGVQWQGYRIGALYRADALVDASRDTADLVQQFNSQGGYTVGRTYALDYSIKGFEASGARISKSFLLNVDSPWQVNVGLGLSYLKGQRVKLETVSGKIVTLNTKDFNASAIRNTSDSLMNVSDIAQFNAPWGRIATPAGSGYAADVGLVLQHPDNGSVFEFAVADLFGQIDWTDLPNNNTNYNNATKYYDAKGFVNFNPSATRTSSYQNLSQKLDPKLHLAASYPLGNFDLKVATDYTQGYWFPQTGLSYHITPHWAIAADVDWRFNTLGLSLQHDWFYVNLKTDSTNFDAAKAYGLAAGLQVPF